MGESRRPVADRGGRAPDFLEPEAHAGLQSGGDGPGTGADHGAQLGHVGQLSQVHAGPEPAEIYRMIQDAPNLPERSPGDGGKPPHDHGEGDHRPERDWALIGVLAFTVAFATTTAVRAGVQLLRALA